MTPTKTEIFSRVPYYHYGPDGTYPSGKSKCLLKTSTALFNISYFNTNVSEETEEDIPYTEIPALPRADNE